jgi:hypothetical protein
MFFGHNNGPQWRSRVDARKAFLRASQPDDTITFSQMSAALGVDIPDASDGPLQTAIKELQREGIAFVSLKGEGYKRLAPAAVVTHKALDFVRRAGRLGRRGLRMSRAVPDAALTQQERQMKWGYETALAETARASHGNSLRAAVEKQASKSALQEEMERLASVAAT